MVKIQCESDGSHLIFCFRDSPLGISRLRGTAVLKRPQRLSNGRKPEEKLSSLRSAPKNRSPRCGRILSSNFLEVKFPRPRSWKRWTDRRAAKTLEFR